MKRKIIKQNLRGLINVMAKECKVDEKKGAIGEEDSVLCGEGSASKILLKSLLWGILFALPSILIALAILYIFMSIATTRMTVVV